MVRYRHIPLRGRVYDVRHRWGMPMAFSKATKLFQRFSVDAGPDGAAQPPAPNVAFQI